ncbi:NAD-dependent epimerase/dehydratase family protein [Sphingomonas sp. LaA6.9]|uniref:NAD-dependent epimerase/dehydratase family protein n=1 Tax=Sphingomonas sp. LaA6.9 TaxID=2919914 RepID=UPI001F4F2AD1|nr:NAD-dependent epimerase/dehydratase family protein [Sphingomonas sp. LaA6.9]MCJ8159301.1 NAD-dependent epimerase/dehydratase family protein [Sphingomonas sp. LaA6.9]
MQFYSRVVENDVKALLSDLVEVLPRFAGTTVLVTGAGGFLMSYIVETLLAWNETGSGDACRVIALDNFKTGVPERLAHLEALPNFRLVRHDISDPLDLDEPVDWIVHGASIASPTVYRQYPLETISANVDGTRHLLELARRSLTRGMIVMSTSEIYGDPHPDFIPTPEDYRGYVSCTGPRACYDESKRMAETLAVTHHRLFGTPIKLVRPFNVYGPGLRLDDRRVLPDFMTCVLEDRPIELLSDGAPTRSFCYVSDAIALMMRTLASDFAGDAINTGNDEVEISMRDLAEAVSRTGASVLGRAPIAVRYQASEDSDYLVDNPQRRCPDLSRARHLFPDWSPKVGLEDGLSRLIQHLVEKNGIRIPVSAEV